MDQQQPDNVLVVDDDAAVRTLVRATLSARGVRVTEAGNGQLGLDEVRRAPGQFDLILMDYHMPELDGIRAAQAMRACAPGAPVVLMSTEDLSPQLEQIKVSGFLPKPFRAQQLIQLVDSHLQRRS
ncbi:MAG: response regulator [Gammaproteobacteria bacterium]|nr:response regulator [Gammaproteobacteria bacterium]NNF61818.1 response regulator [Gammaproteobacteria bacterium]NNM19742.1 response regulator [Gammaproteobacteria bacterium]